MRTIDAHALRAAYEDKMKELVKATNVENVSLETLSLLCGAKLIEEAPTVGGWINVKDRLPEKEGRYLVLTSGIFGIKIAMFTMSLKRHFDYMFEDGEPDRPGFYNWDSEDDWIQDDVTHWMPLPEPPTKEGIT